MGKWLRLFLSAFTSCILLVACAQGVDDKKAADPEKVAQLYDKMKPLLQGSKECMDILKEVVALDPMHDDALRELSVAHLKRGMPQEWSPQYQKAIDVDPQTWTPWRGYLYLWFYRDYEKAIADFNASDTLTPHLDHPQGHSVDYWRGIAYLGAKDFDNSIVFFDKHIDQVTKDTGADWVEAEAFLYRGIAHYQKGNKENALRDFDFVIENFGQYTDAKYHKSKILLEQGEAKKAVPIIEGAIQDFESGYFNHHDYVEVFHQLYPEDYAELKSAIKQ